LFYIVQPTLIHVSSKAGVNGCLHWMALVVCCCLISSRETMQIGLATAATKAAFVNCRLAGPDDCEPRTSPPSPTEYKQACNFMGPLPIPTAESENRLAVCAVFTVGYLRRRVSRRSTAWGCCGYSVHSRLGQWSTENTVVKQELQDCLLIKGGQPAFDFFTAVTLTLTRWPWCSNSTCTFVRRTCVAMSCL